jgi:ketosteroid isomerase-like protein
VSVGEPDDVADLVRRTAEATSAWIQGDMETYLALTPHASGFTLLNPFGGAAARYEDRAESIRATAGFFQGGEAALEALEVHAWHDTVVLVMVERQRGRIGGLPEQDLSLRVTQVHRRMDGEWQLVHRHADPLVHPIDLERFTALARG